MHPHPENFQEWENEDWSHYINRSESIRVRAYLISENRDTIQDLKDKIRALEEQIYSVRSENSDLWEEMINYREMVDRGEEPEADDTSLENIKSLLEGNH